MFVNNEIKEHRIQIDGMAAMFTKARGKRRESIMKTAPMHKIYGRGGAKYRWIALNQETHHRIRSQSI